MLKAVFFDLDGTLLDTAPDMIGALDALRADHSLAPADYAAARAQVSNGAAGLLRLGFDHLDDAGREALRQPYLDRYAARLARATTPFPGMLAVLDALDAAQMPWGVVTNKPAFLTDPLLAALDLARRSAVTVSGDTLAQRKPHPEPLLHAARHVGVDCRRIVYVGDAPRDIEAGRAAGMVTVAVTYGYHSADEDPTAWGADHLVESPKKLLELPGLPGNA